MKNSLFVNNSIKVFRAKHNISQQELANQIGTTQITISNIESGKYLPSIKLALLLSVYFEVPVSDLFWLSKD